MLRYQTFLLLALVILSGCTQDGQDPESQFDVSQDIEGNLLILNRLNGPVLLYTSESESPLKEIGAKEDFIVNISSDGSTPTPLQIWKKSQVADPSKPDIEKIYKEWFSLECQHGLSDLRMLGDLKDENYVPNIKNLVYKMIAEAT